MSYTTNDYKPVQHQNTFQVKQETISHAVTIKKSQGLTLLKFYLFIQRHIFSHAQLYMVVSRVKSERGLKLLCFDMERNYVYETSNMVYKEVLHAP